VGTYIAEFVNELLADLVFQKIVIPRLAPFYAVELSWVYDTTKSS
jgi:hypothetical protein